MGRRHMADFLEAVRTRGTAACPPEDGYRTTLTVQLGMIAYRGGAKIHRDGRAERIPDNEAAARLLKRAYRAPWKHPYAGGDDGRRPWAAAFGPAIRCRGVYRPDARPRRP